MPTDGKTLRPWRDKSRRDVWQLIIELGRDENGKRRWKYESVHGTKGHAKKVSRQRLNELEAGTYVEPTDLTVAEYLRSWHKDHARHHLSASALESNGYTLERHVIPGLGGHELAKLRAMHRRSRDPSAALSGHGLGAATHSSTPESVT